MYRRNEKVQFSLHSNIGKKKLAACLLHNIDIAVVSELNVFVIGELSI